MSGLRTMNPGDDASKHVTGTEIGNKNTADVNIAATTGLTVSTATVTSVGSSTVVQTVVAANAARKFLIIYNDSGGDCTIKYGSGASPTSQTFTFGQGAIHLMRGPIYTGIVTCIFNSTDPTKLIDVTEG